jgi:hypothetical protein
VKQQATLPLDAHAGGTCEVCGEDNIPVLLQRHPPHGLRCCFACHGANGTELAAAYGRRLERAAKR